MSKQPEALRLADELLEPIPDFPEPTTLEKAAADELRRLHASNAELLEALQYAHAALVTTVDYQLGRPTAEYAAAKASAAIAKAGGNHDH